MANKNIPVSDFKSRRKEFLKRLGTNMCVLPSSAEVIRNYDVTHPYRQDSNFYYLSGLAEPHSILVFAPTHKHPFQVFVEPVTEARKLWDGETLGPDRAKKLLGADAAYPSIPQADFDKIFVEALINSTGLYYQLGVCPIWDARILRLVKETQSAPVVPRSWRPFWSIHDPNQILGEMRLVKRKDEIARLQIAGHISAEGHVHAMKITRPGMFEYEVEAAVAHSFSAQGSQRLGYGSIVAGGNNACVLHYKTNRDQLKDGDLLLIDAGAEFDYYTGDITRVFPINGRFTEPQKEIYAAVLKAQTACIAYAKPGRTMSDIHNLATEVLIEELRRLKILKGTTKSILKNKQHLPYFPHGTSHWLGLDVHDVGKKFVGDNITNLRKLEPGHCITVEPGLYFRNGGPGPSRYHGIGVRIEDDILITQDGCQVLTSGVPKEIDEVESLCSQL